jgi:PAS domain S-box-containing protein
MKPRPDARRHPCEPSASVTPPGPSLSSGRLFILFAPVLALIALATILAITAWTVGWYRPETLRAAELVAGAAGALAAILLFRQIRQRQAANLALQSVTARVGDIVESAMDAIVATDESQRIVLFNPAAEGVFGWPRDAVLGQPIDKLLPPRLRDKHRGHIEQFGRTGTTARRMGGQTVLTGLRANGEEFPIEASISKHTEEGRQLFTVILRDVSERIRAEDALRRSKEELRELGAAANLAREQEQSRIARELHDELGQTLTALQMDVAWCKALVPEDQPATLARHAKMQAMLKETVAATRRIAADLRPLILDDLGLVPAVEWLVEGFAQRNGIPCDLSVGSPKIELPSAHATTVFRIIQESLTNVAKHAQASHVKVSLERNGADVTFGILDNGVGFSPRDPRKPNSYGLLGLRERTSLLGGELTITSAPGEGTHVRVRLPLESPTAPS